MHLFWNVILNNLIERIHIKFFEHASCSPNLKCYIVRYRVISLLLFLYKFSTYVLTKNIMTILLIGILSYLVIIGILYYPLFGRYLTRKHLFFFLNLNRARIFIVFDSRVFVTVILLLLLLLLFRTVHFLLSRRKIVGIELTVV